jgi:hypothetical protein
MLRIWITCYITERPPRNQHSCRLGLRGQRGGHETHRPPQQLRVFSVVQGSEIIGKGKVSAVCTEPYEGSVRDAYYYRYELKRAEQPAAPNEVRSHHV